MQHRKARRPQPQGSTAGRMAAPAPIRMQEVAERAGVSVITVSRTLSAPEKVLPETRERVQAVIRELGYVPNQVAGTLANSRSRIIAVIVPNLSNSVFTDTLESMEHVLRHERYHLMIGHSGYSTAEEEELVRAFLSHRPAGIVLTGYTHSRGTTELARNAGIPVVEMWNRTDEPIDSNIGFSNFEAARAMALHLGGRGYRRIGYIGGLTDDNDRTQQREAGFRAAMDELGLPIPPQAMTRAPFEFTAGAAAFGELVGRVPDLDAVFAAGDILAVGAMMECQRRGWRVPDRIAIAGFDGTPLATLTTPRLTTVRVPQAEMGAAVAEHLLDRIHGRAERGLRRDLGFSLVVRESA